MAFMKLFGVNLWVEIALFQLNVLMHSLLKGGACMKNGAEAPCGMWATLRNQAAYLPSATALRSAQVEVGSQWTSLHAHLNTTRAPWGRPSFVRLAR